MKPKNLIEIKAKMLCEGVNVTSEIERLFLEQNPFKVKRGGLSSGGKMKLAGTIQVNAPFYKNRKVDLKLVSDFSNPGGFVVDYYGEPLCTGEVLKAPDWYKETIGEFSITQILTAHGKQLAGAIYEDCSLFKIKEECKFCVINLSLKNKSPFLVRKKSVLFLEAISKIPSNYYNGLTLNGGLTLHPGRGMEIIEPVVRDFNAVEYSLKVFGNGKVSSCFVVGTENAENLKNGIKAIIDMGIIPSPLGGRYFEDIPNYPFVPKMNFH